jgi:hypothetical protein
MSRDKLEELKEHVYSQVTRTIPGFLSFLGVLCRVRYGVDPVSLLFSSPSNLYAVLLMHYCGDVNTADYAFTIAFVNPIVNYLKKPELTMLLLELVKTGRNKEFLDLLAEHL